MMIAAPFGTTVSGTLEKMIGCFGTAPFGGARIEAAPGEFVRVLVIVLADAEDVAARARNRRLDAHGVEVDL